MTPGQRVDLEEALQIIRGRRLPDEIQLRHLKALYENGEKWADMVCALVRRIDRMDLQAAKALTTADRMKAS